MTKGTPDRSPCEAVDVDEPIGQVIELVGQQIEQRELLSRQSLPRVLDLIDRFRQFVARSFDTETIGDVTPKNARDFVVAPSGKREPAVATMHFRRSAVRLLFRVARELKLADGDPTLDLELPPRSSRKLRPLTDEEVALCRSFSLHTLLSTRPSATWALAEATATTSEIPRIRVRDVDLDGGQVWIPGGKSTEPRQGWVDPWGRLQIERRLRALPDSDPDRPVIYEGHGSAASRQASSCLATSQTLVRVGLGGEPEVRPASVIAWAGARLFVEGHPIEEVTRRLGRRSLDRTAQFIGWDWRATDG